VETANVNWFSSTTQVDGRVVLKRQSYLLAHTGFKGARATAGVITLEEVSQHWYACTCIIIKTSIRQNGTGKYTNAL
jgi:hypothetical protein